MDASLTTPLAALAAGLATSLHCTVMCGPLACALRVRPLEYHLSRFASYTIAGGFAGAIGGTVAAALQGSTARLVPWVFALVLLILGLGLEKRLPQPRFLAGWLLKARLNRSLGWLTPLLPCGPLWLILGAAATTGAWWNGALHMAAFAVGTIPLPIFLQFQATRWQSAISPQTARLTQQVLTLAAAALLIWRAALPLHASCH